MTRYLLLFDSYGFVFVGHPPPLTRGRVCLLYMLLTLASAVFLGSESLETRVGAAILGVGGLGWLTVFPDPAKQMLGYARTEARVRSPGLDGESTVVQRKFPYSRVYLPVVGQGAEQQL
jgi:hypothetical protein